MGRIVIYRSKVGDYDLPAVITATVDTLAPAGVRRWRESGGVEGVPRLSSRDHVHLTVFSPGAAGNPEPPAPLDRNVGGTYRQWDVPVFEPHSIADPRPGAQPEMAPVDPGSWRWPVRV